MTAWNSNVQVHTQTWMYLFLKEELLTSFPDSKEVKMEQLAWWNALATPDIRQVDALKFAIEVNRFFSDAMKRPYEAAFRMQMNPLSHLVDHLVVADNTVPMLADTINQIFRFKNE